MRPAGEDLVERLVDREEAAETGREGDTYAALAPLSSELDQLVGQLRQPAPPDEFADEGDCRRAIDALLRDRTWLAPDDARSPVEATVESLDHARLLGHYRLLEKLGEGGMGAVYKALHTRLEKVVALKLLPAEQTRHETAVTRFEREMRAVGKLRHPNIVAAHDAGEVDGTHYLVMELVEGVDLASLLRGRGRFPVEAGCELVRQAALGLQHAHDHGLVHRDVKPSNLMLARPDGDEPPRVKVLDLGLALLSGSPAKDDELTAAGAVMGTIDYMAPEQATDTHAVDARADVYGLGATLYKILSGQAPFAGQKYGTPVKRLLALTSEDPPDVAALRPDLPPELAAIVMKMVARRPGDRFNSAREVAEALTPFAQQAELHEILAAPLEAADDAAPTESRIATVGSQAATLDESGARALPQPTREPRAGRFRRRGRPAIAATMLALTACAAAYVVRVQTGRGEVIVDSDIDGIAVSVVRNGATVDDHWEIRKGADNRLSVRTGDVQISLPESVQGEYRIVQDEFELSRNGTIVARIVRRPAAARPAPAIDAERRVAKWVLSHGGDLQLSGPGNPGVERPEDLPREPFKILNIRLRGGLGLSAKEVAVLDELPDLGAINLFEGALSEDALLHFLRHHPKLNWLHIAGPGSGDGMLAALADCPDLDYLWIWRGTFTEAGAAHFAEYKSLTALYLDYVSLGEVGVEAIASLPNLQRFSLSDVQAADSWLSILKRQPRLQWLWLTNLATDQALETVAELPALTELTLARAPLTDAGLGPLARITGLSVLSLTDTKIGDDGLTHLHQLKALTKLDLIGTRATRTGIESLRAALPQCRIKSDFGN